MIQPLWKTVWRPLKKLKIDLPYDLIILLLGIYLEEIKLVFPRDISTSILITALFTITKTWKQAKCPSIDNR